MILIPNFDNDIVSEASKALFEYYQQSIDESHKGFDDDQILIDLAVYDLISGDYSPEISTFLEDEYQKTKEEKYLTLLNIYKFMNGKFNIFEPFKGADPEMWRNSISNSYTKSLVKEDDAQNKDFQKSFKKVISGKFKEVFIEYVGQRKDEMDPRVVKKQRVEDSEAANDNVGPALAGAAAAVNDNTPSASPRGASASPVSEGKKPAVAKQ